MTPEIAALQVQVAAIQANVVWLTKLVWYMIGLNAVGFVMNGFSIIRTNSKGKGGG